MRRPKTDRRVVTGARWVCLLIFGVLATAACQTGASAATPRPAKGWWEAALVPPTEAGWIGWCTEIVTRESTGESCPVDPEAGDPLVDESWGGGGPPPTIEASVVTSGEVTSVFFDRQTVPTRRGPRLPFGLRAARVEIPGVRFSLLGTFPSFTLLNQSGQPLAQPRRKLLIDSVQSAFWQRPQHPPRGICALSSRLSGLTAQWGKVALHAEGRNGILGQGFLSCADTEYFLHKWPLQATVLLNGQTPGAPPAALPNMKPLAKHPGIWVERGMLARRSKHTWLLVKGGHGLAQQIEVLDSLQVRVSV